MGRTAEVVATERSPGGALDVRADRGGALITAQHFSDAGGDSAPLPRDSVALEESAGAGAVQVSGYCDPRNACQSDPGEKRIYSRAADARFDHNLKLTQEPVN
jgi:hypothetical protein